MNSRDGQRSLALPSKAEHLLRIGAIDNFLGDIPMKSAFIIAALASAGLAGISAFAHAEPVSTPAAPGIVGTLNTQTGLFKPLAAASPAASASPAATVTYNGTLVVKITAANKSAVPTNSKIDCGVGVILNNSQFLAYSSKAQITAATLNCTVTIPYRTTVSNPASSFLSVSPLIFNSSPNTSSGLNVIQLPGTSIPLPANGAVTTQTFSTVL